MTFNSYGGPKVDPQTVKKGEKATKPKDLEVKGYTFLGWCSDALCKNFYDFEQPVNADITLYAKWKKGEDSEQETGVTYSIVGSTPLTWVKNSIKAVTITVKRSEDDASCFSHFTGVEIDGKELTKDTDYTAVSGSTVVTLKTAALRKLSTGDHTVTVNFDDGKAETKLTVTNTSGGSSSSQSGSGSGSASAKNTSKTKAAKTADTANVGAWLTIAAAALILMIGILNRERKAVRHFHHSRK